MRIRVRSSARASSPVRKVLLSLFLLLFLGFGVWFTSLAVQGIAATARTYSFPEAECEVLDSGVAEDPEAAGEGERFRFTVRYRYSWAGQVHEGERYRPGYAGSDEPSDAYRLAAAYPAGARVRCWVDPDDPGRAMLARPSPWTGLVILIPLAFVAVGAGGLYLTWRPRTRAPAEAPAAATSSPPAAFGSTSLSRRARASRPGCLVAFFSVFLLSGLGFLSFFLLPAVNVVRARGWDPVPCTILESRVASHSDSDGTTYSVEVLFSYTVDGVAYKSGRYGFLGGSSSGYEGKAAVVERYPAGSRATCWVDPEDPTQAVLERGFTAAYLFGLIPLLFVAVGAGGAAWALTGARRRRRAERTPWLPRVEAEPAAPGAAAGPGVVGDLALAGVPAGAGGPVVLEARHSPLGKLVGITLIAAFWNGITGIFVWQAIAGWRSGSGDGCLTLFILPFVAIGLLLLAGVPYQFLALFNPRLRLTLSAARVPLGGSAQLTWRFSRLPGRIRRLRIVLEGTEAATYRQGTTTRTARETFATVTVAETQRKPEIASGAATLAVPGDTMHSFSAPHNKVTWKLKASGEIRFWPDVSEEYELVVLPRGEAP